MSKFIKLTNGIDGVSDLIVNVDLIRTVILECDGGCSLVEFWDDQNVVVKETPERILKMIESAK